MFKQNPASTRGSRLRSLTGALAFTASLHAFPALAEPSYSFSGFSTLGLVRSSENRADFLAHDLQGGGAGRDHEWSTDVDSKVGLQLTATLTDRFSGVLQVLSTQQYDGTFRPQVEWANLKYQVTPDFDVRVGRFLIGTFLTSDYRNVGYALPWVRPPVEVYGLIPMTSTDGVDMHYRLHFGEVTHTLHAAYGESEARVPDGGKAITDNSWLISDTMEYGAATLRVVYTRGKFTLDSDQVRPLFNGYRDIANNALIQTFFPDAAEQAGNIVDKYDVENTRSSFIGVGASYDPGQYFVMAEWGQTETNSAFGKRTGWYVSGGYRIGAWTPYVTYSQAYLKSSSRARGIETTGNPLVDVPADELDAGLNFMLSEATVQRTTSVGVRWDFMKNAAFKLQYDHSRMGDRSPGTLDHPTDDFRVGGRYDVWSATVDFVF